MPRKQVLQKTHDPALAELRHRMRHSASHVMAEAVLRLFPGASLAIGPATEEGFYYDFDLPRSLTPDDLAKIESLMRESIDKNAAFQRREIGRDEAKKQFASQPFKLELIEDIPEGEAISTYRHGDFEDLCSGPHVESTGKIPAFKLLNVAGAYWRGDEHRPMLQRIYGTAFESKEALDEYLRLVEEAERRDHRKLGRQLDLFSISDRVGPGLVLWHPKGARMRLVMEDYWRDLHDRYDYLLVNTPHVGRSTLWETSGHLGFYKDNMFSPMDIEGQSYFVKPMNCPFHIEIYMSALRSYRDLPMRIGEIASVYRYERSGVLHGLMRVRGFAQDDAHIFCRPDQVASEVEGVLDLTFELLSTYGFKDYAIMLSTRPEKAVGDQEMWRFATQSLEQTLDKRGIEYDVDEGGGAFYGPKIDLKIRDALGREWQCTTVQFDFNMPERFGITFQGADGQAHRPYMVHRAIYGSLERFFGVLIEHYAGAFPLWLAPVQAVLIPIADRHLPYAQTVLAQLREHGFRAQVDDRSERMNLKIREAQLQKVPYMLVAGDKEVASSGVSVRLRSGEDLGAMPVAALVERMQRERKERV